MENGKEIKIIPTFRSLRQVDPKSWSTCIHWEIQVKTGSLNLKLDIK